MSDKSLRELQAMVHKTAVEHGWWDAPERPFCEVVVLMHSELSEAIEEFRNGRGMTEVYENPHKVGKLEGIPVEMADCIIRILDWCGRHNIDMQDILEKKAAYNESRPYKHGKVL